MLDVDEYTLCLSGGGFRATLFHLGVIRRLIYLKMFEKVARINSVSGGSIAAGMVMTELTKKPFISIEDFNQRVVDPLISFIHLCPRKFLCKFLPFRNDPMKFAKLLDKNLYHGVGFNKLASNPLWYCYATSLDSAKSWKFSQIEVGDSQTGYAQPIYSDKISIGVAASACLPFFFKPLIFETKRREFIFKYMNGALVNQPNPLPSPKISLCDGGVYDNLGSESVFAKNNSFIISDASGVVSHLQYSNSIFSKACRPIDILKNQNGCLRRRLIFQKLVEFDGNILIELSKPLSTYTDKNISQKKSSTEPQNMPSYFKIGRDLEKIIGEIRTDLDDFHSTEIELLLWNGMIKIDAALKRWCPNLIPTDLWEDTPKLNLDPSTALKTVLSIQQRWRGNTSKTLMINTENEYDEN